MSQLRSQRYFDGVVFLIVGVVHQPYVRHGRRPRRRHQRQWRVAAQAQPVTISGQIRRSGTLKPVTKAAVIVEGTSLQATSDNDGRFSIAGVAAGTHHLVIAAPGLMPCASKSASAPSTIRRRSMSCLDPEVHYTEVVTVSSDGARPVRVVSADVGSGRPGVDEGSSEATLGATLQRQPGVAERSFGPGPSRPVIRGLDGDRVLDPGGWPAGWRSVEPVGRPWRRR